VIDDEAHLLDESRSLTTKSAWHRFVNDTPTMPTMLPDDEWKALDPNERDLYDEMRLRHHGRLVTITTPLVNDVIRLGRPGRSSPGEAGDMFLSVNDLHALIPTTVVPQASAPTACHRQPGAHLLR
jgi:hypothetical protein